MVARLIVAEVTLKTIPHIQEGKEAKTEFTVMERFRNYTLLDVRIHSGRTHQIRVHMHAYTHPVVGDPLYVQKQFVAKSAPTPPRLFLHATSLAFTDLLATRQEYHSDLPQELSDFLPKLAGSV